MLKRRGLGIAGAFALALCLAAVPPDAAVRRVCMSELVAEAIVKAVTR